MNKCYTDYQEYLIQKLKDPEKAIAYLNAALEDEDERVFLLALKDVHDAQGEGMTGLSRKTKLSRENLHRMLSKKGNPNWNSIMSVIKAMNLQLAIHQPLERRGEALKKL